MWDIFIKWLIPFLCGGAVSALGVVIGRIKLGKKKQDALALGLQCLLRAEIISQYENGTSGAIARFTQKRR